MKLFEDIFPYHEIPRIPFDGPIVELIKGKQVTFDPQEALARDLHITDTTFRDGQQARPPYTVEQIVHLFGLLAKLGAPPASGGLVRQSEFFLYSPKDREAVEHCLALGLPYPEITGWIRADLGDLRLVREMGLRETGILMSISDYHITYKLKKTRKQIVEEYLRVAETALAAGIRPRCHLEDLTRADIEGFVIPFVEQLARLTANSPPELRVKIRLCDTLGLAVTYPGAALPRSLPKLIHAFHEVGFPPERLEWHGHNDFHKVHINAASAWLYGCNTLNGTLLGYGERTGNPPLEAAVIEYLALKGHQPGIETTVITEIADYYRTAIGYEIPRQYPFVGDECNQTRAGIHALGMARDARTYNSFDTAALLNRPPRIAINDKSGVDGIAFWLNTHLGLTGHAQLSKTRVAKIARWVQEQYEQGRITTISEEEMAEQIRLHLPDHAAHPRTAG